VVVCLGRTRAASHVVRTARLARVEECRTPAFKTAAAWFFRLKAVGCLPTGLRGTLQRALGAAFWRQSQMTAEELLREIDVAPEGLLGSVRARAGCGCRASIPPSVHPGRIETPRLGCPPTNLKRHLATQNPSQSENANNTPRRAS
jgi:hypothetical protein